MIKVRILNNPYQDYCKYKEEAFEQLFDLVRRLDVKRKFYKNGNIDYWFKNKQFKDNKEVFDALAFESIPFEVRKLK